MGSVNKKQDLKRKPRGARKSASTKPLLQESSGNVSTKPEGKFVNDLLIRGEAAKQDEHGRLPLDATHVIVEGDSDGSVQVKRVRFKAF